MRRWVTRRFWSTYRDSGSVRRALAERLAQLGPQDRGLNVGAGFRTPDPRLINLDREATAVVHCIADAQWLPFMEGTFALVISQEVVEHLPEPFQAVREMARTLAPGGTLYLQVPFIIGYHPEPEDYWRFTHAGVRRLIEQAGLHCERVEAAFGAGTGMYRIVVEFLAGLAARLLPPAYAPGKGLLAVALYPLRWLDGALNRGAQRHRITGGYYGVGRKPG